MRLSKKKKRRNVDAWTQTQYPNGYLEGQVINIGCTTTTKLTIYRPFYQLNKKRISMLFFNDYKKKKLFFHLIKSLTLEHSHLVL